MTAEKRFHVISDWFEVSRTCGWLAGVFLEGERFLLFERAGRAQARNLRGLGGKEPYVGLALLDN